MRYLVPALPRLGCEDAAQPGLECVARTSPSGRLSRDSDYAALVELLFSPDAEFIQGQVIHANGGAYVSAWAGRAVPDDKLENWGLRRE